MTKDTELLKVLVSSSPLALALCGWFYGLFTMGGESLAQMDDKIISVLIICAAVSAVNAIAGAWK